MTPENRRIAALDVLERLRRHEMEEEARELGQLRGRIAQHEQTRDGLERDLRDETRDSTLESARYVADYVRAVRAQIVTHAQAIAALEAKAEGLEDRVRARFRDMRTIGTLSARARSRRAAEHARREAEEMAEIGLQRWQRDPRRTT
ncbi:hypothetical protein EKE94_16000 [Mesobaculum littorinae]|uniref:Flagellar FliJ protein n=1 Tax=Mesobaculum littorinae TaxID=2486419 RepID=A0A438ADW6_9RHOB|nr:flagellar FliJ family protein [Mesobaculum littorinae]RVV96848.1 hypothetical protein EKE94_16000 [Mesobaculum littorinae]